MEDLNTNKQSSLVESLAPQVNANASGGAGGAGGQAITLSYTDNYSSLMLVYTFLLNLANTSSMSSGESMKSEMNLLLPVLQTAMDEEKKYRDAFLSAVQSLGK